MLPSRGRKFYSEFKPNGSGKRLCSCARRNQALLSSPAFRAMGTGASTAFERGYKYLAPLTASVLPKAGGTGTTTGNARVWLAKGLRLFRSLDHLE